MQSVDVREHLTQALDLDLVGPDNDSPLATEWLPQAPSRWYLTGFLVPLLAGAEQRADETAGDEVDGVEETGGSDDDTPPEPAAARRAFFPSSMGVSFLVAPGTDRLDVTARWGDYARQPREDESGDEATAEAPDAEDAETGDDVSGDDVSGDDVSGGDVSGDDVSGDDVSGDDVGADDVEARARWLWRRVPREAKVGIDLPGRTERPLEVDLPDGDGLRLALSVRPVSMKGRAVPKGTRAVSVFLVNARQPAANNVRDRAFAFQAELAVESAVAFVPRPDPRGLESEDWDERVADLQYRDAAEYASGHGVATRAELDGDGECRKLRTCWIPRAEVERVEPGAIDGVVLELEELAQVADRAGAGAALGELPRRYREWIRLQQEGLDGPDARRRETAEELLQRAEAAAARIEAGIDMLADDTVRSAFCLANDVMATAIRRRIAIAEGVRPERVDPPRWRPFQLAFLLVNIVGLADDRSHDREVVDLLFFPTGGGKTEAYFGLAAFTLILRRLRHPGLASAGMTVLMRYTLRLLTLDQLGRAATLICALERKREALAAEALERGTEPPLGEWPFEIGLWVGRGATPNRMGRKGDGDQRSARAKTISFQNNPAGKPSPIPLEECPWCGERFKPESFQLTPTPDEPHDLRVQCSRGRDCDFVRGRYLPIVAVDEPIYRRLPCFLIATVDKFAAMPWTGEVGKLFGRGVDRGDQDGFYGATEKGFGTRLPALLRPPELVIQDELHLIGGPMGTMVGLYETALDELCTRKQGERRIRPKIVASTATVRRAEGQIRALFARREVDVFPPPGPDRRDSFFARTRPAHAANARRYVGIAAQGRSLKVVLLRSYLALLGAGEKHWRAAGGSRAETNPADPYMTLLGYFNSLRELGGSRRIVEDEILTRLTTYARRRRLGEKEGLFADRTIRFDVVELTSRVSTDQVADARRRLGLPFRDDEHVDVAIATNMISVGLDITRLGLMVVLGQPKSGSEYIQATSRVGRDAERPGLVVTLLNIHRPRDRSHYESFANWHESFYRSVEAISVTPFSPRALDRGLAGAVVGLARHGHLPLTPATGAGAMVDERGPVSWVADVFAERAVATGGVSGRDAEAIRHGVQHAVADLLDSWETVADSHREVGSGLKYQRHEKGAPQRLLYDFLDPELETRSLHERKFRAGRSLRDVEPSVYLWMKGASKARQESGE